MLFRSENTAPNQNVSPMELSVRIGQLCMRLLKDDGAIFYNHKWRVQKGVLKNRADIVDGFPVRHIVIWQRAGVFCTFLFCFNFDGIPWYVGGAWRSVVFRPSVKRNWSRSSNVSP